MVNYMYDSDRMFNSFLKESAVRTTGAGFDTQIAAGTTTYKWDEFLGDSIDPPETEPEFEEHFAIGGDADVSNIYQMGFNLGEGSYEMAFQSGIFLNYALGSCTTTIFHHLSTWDAFDGSSTALACYCYAVAGVHAEILYLRGINSDGVFESANATLNNQTAVIVNSTAADSKWKYLYYFTADGTGLGDEIRITNAGKTTTYLSSSKNAANNELGNTLTGGGGNYTDYYYHAITERSTSLPTFAWHWEWKNATTANNLIEDYMGCSVKALEIKTEKKAKVTQNATINCCKKIAGTAQTAEPSAMTTEVIKWDDLQTFALTYNAVAIDSSIKDYTESITWKIDNTYDVMHPMGDSNPKTQHMGKREVEYSLSYYPRDSNTEPTVAGGTLYKLYKTNPEGGYPYDLKMVLQWRTSQYRFMQIKSTKLYVKSHTRPQKNANENMDQLCEATLRSHKDNVHTIDVIDSIASAQYSG